MRQQNRKGICRDLRNGFLNVVCPIEMRIINAGQENPLSATSNRFALVEQHADTHSFH
jgi:hypothetical protein